MKAGLGVKERGTQMIMKLLMVVEIGTELYNHEVPRTHTHTRRD